MMNSYKGGQNSISHLESDLYSSVKWANENGKRWAFTLSNAGSNYFEDRSSLDNLDEIDWSAVNAIRWSSCKEGKQAEFLLEEIFPWHLVERVGVNSRTIYQQVVNILSTVRDNHSTVELKIDWYY